jgi:hypothetical protein
MRKHTSYVSIRQHTSASRSTSRIHLPHVSIRPHTSAYVSIRQALGVYRASPSTRPHVSIRPHTSAYESIRQHTSDSRSVSRITFHATVTNPRPSATARSVPTFGSTPRLRPPRHTPACISIRQHTSAYVSVRVPIFGSTPRVRRPDERSTMSIRQHPYAHVSIRTHTSAYARL